MHRLARRDGSHAQAQYSYRCPGVRGRRDDAVVLSAIGLAFDLVGAIALVRGLFRRPRPLTVGWAYSPDQAASDFAYGVTGGTFLATGFVLQALTYFGVSVDGSDRTALLAAVAAVVVGAVVAVLLYAVTFLVVLPFEIRYSIEKLDLHLHVRRQRKGLRFWNQVPTPPPSDSGAGPYDPRTTELERAGGRTTGPSSDRPRCRRRAEHRRRLRWLP
jgi:hypothetical protein